MFINDLQNHYALLIGLYCMRYLDNHMIWKCFPFFGGKVKSRIGHSLPEMGCIRLTCCLKTHSTWTHCILSEHCGPCFVDFDLGLLLFCTRTINFFVIWMEDVDVFLGRNNFGITFFFYRLECKWHLRTYVAFSLALAHVLTLASISSDLQTVGVLLNWIGDMGILSLLFIMWLEMTVEMYLHCF